MPLRVCTVSFKSPTGITHGVDVEAETLYEAAGLGLARLKKDGWIEGLGPGSRLEIHVREPSTLHTLTVQQLNRWNTRVAGVKGSLRSSWVSAVGIAGASAHRPLGRQTGNLQH